MKVFSLFDTKVGTFGTPFFSATDGAAVRMVIDAARDKAGSLFGQHPEDFILYGVGVFDEDTGALTGTTLKSHGTIAALVAAAQREVTGNVS